MDKQQQELEAQLKNAQIEKVKDSNNLQAIKVTFENGILFAINSSQLNASSKADLNKLAQNLVQNPETNVQVFGYTDNTGSQQLNERLSLQRAESVVNYLVSDGVRRVVFLQKDSAGMIRWHRMRLRKGVRKIGEWKYILRQLRK